MLSINHIQKSYGSKAILHDLSIDIPEGKVTTLLGPSGCGKTTLLRLIAGLEKPGAGEITFRGATWVSTGRHQFLAPQKRNIGLVFQSYAIWPHMNVFDQIAYPLRNRGMARQRVEARVEDLLRVVGLEGYGARPSTSLSGGQQQRVAMARALAPDPSVLLLDEPFSNLDVSLRAQLRLEVRALQHRLGVTIVLVTHDQLDAFALSDQIALMRDGRIEQLGSCEDIYERPATDFVRAFMGKSIPLRGRVESRGVSTSVFSMGEGAMLRLPNHLLPSAAVDGRVEGEIDIWLRPEDLQVSRGDANGGALKGTIRDVMYLGERFECIVDLAIGQAVVLHAPRSLRPMRGDSIHVEAVALSTSTSTSTSTTMQPSITQTGASHADPA